ncbi:MAG: DUF1592 domain-containing protein [Pseudomonadota bacterium]
MPTLTIAGPSPTSLSGAFVLLYMFLAAAVFGHSAAAYDANEFLDTFCERCHNDERLSGNWSLSMISADDIAAGRQLHEWENILRNVRRAEMPPPRSRRKKPSGAERAEFVHWLETALDNRAEAYPDPGRATLRRLNRVEYGNAVRDLLRLDVDVSDALPADDTGYGFDNIADVLSVSPTLMDRYFAVAEKLSALATGTASAEPYVTTYVLPKDGSVLNQGVPSFDWRMSEALPLDSRGGGAFKFYAPYSGSYVISGHLNSNTNNETDRLEANRVEQPVYLAAGMHSVGISFRKSLALDERVQILRNTTDIVHLPVDPPKSLTLDFVIDGARIASQQVPSYFMSERYAQQNFLRDVQQIDIDGPYEALDDVTTESTEQVFSCKPSAWPGSDRRCARKIIQRLSTQAFRQPVSEAQLRRLMSLYSEARESASFEEAVAVAIQAILVSPRFIFVQEENFAGPTGGMHRISDYEFATRLALFLWSSLPDEELTALAGEGRLREPHVLDAQLARMLADERSLALTENFAGQWLYLRNLEHHKADVYDYPEFDAPLRAAMRRESELFFTAVLRENQSVLQFLASDYTYLNERLAAHYGIDGVTGPAFRRVMLPEDAGRGGLLGQASILTVTSYGNHTSVVRRGKWILDNLLAAPPPPPPPDVPALVRTRSGKALTAREQLAMHSEDPACASCHVKMDPLGLSLENFDAIGAFRIYDEAQLIDAATEMPDGTPFTGIEGLQSVLMSRSEQFVSAFTQRLMTYALARGVEAIDQPSVRRIVRDAATNDYRIHTIIKGIVTSRAFNYRRTGEEVNYAATQ